MKTKEQRIEEVIGRVEKLYRGKRTQFREVNDAEKFTGETALLVRMVAELAYEAAKKEQRKVTKHTLKGKT